MTTSSLPDADNSNDRSSNCPHLAGYDPLAPTEIRDPNPSFRRARAEAPVFYDETNQLWSIARRTDIIDAFMDADSFSNRLALTNKTPPEAIRHRMPEYPWTKIVVALDGAEHKDARAIVRAPFTPRRAESHVAAIRARTKTLLEPLARDGHIEFVREVAFPLALGVVGDILGIPESDFSLLDRGVEAAHQITGYGALDRNEELVCASTLADLVDYIRATVERRRAEPGDDYISTMLEASGPGEQSEDTDGVVKHVWTIIAAGFETTANQLVIGLKSLLANRDQWELLIADPSLAAGAVEEMLRYRPLVKRLFRVTTRDVTVAGVTIPRDALVALLSGSANHDLEAGAEDPDAFDIRRRAQHVTFGRGVHLCVGAQLARVEMQVVLGELIDRFPGLTLTHEEDVPGPAQLRFDTLLTLHLVNRV